MREELLDLREEIRAGFTQAKTALSAHVVRLEARMTDMEAKMATKEDIGRVIGHIEAFSRDVEAAQRDRAQSSDAYMRHQRQLEDHESRLGKLERDA